MQVILVKPVRKLGKVGEIVNVKNGYGRNYLLPYGFAIRATKENQGKFAAIEHELKQKNDNEKAKMVEATKVLNGKSLTFVTQSGADGRLFGSISLRGLASALSDMAGFKLNYSNILLEEPIKFNGVYDVQVMLHPEIFASVVVAVAKTESEAQDALIEHKNKDSKPSLTEDTQEV